MKNFLPYVELKSQMNEIMRLKPEDIERIKNWEEVCLEFDRECFNMDQFME